MDEVLARLSADPRAALVIAWVERYWWIIVLAVFAAALLPWGGSRADRR